MGRMEGPVAPHRLRTYLVVAATAASVSASYLMTWLNGDVVHGATAAWNGFGETTSWALLMGSATALGALVAIRRPENRLGTVLLVSGLLGTISMLGDGYAGYALVTAPGTVPGGVVSRFVSFLAFAATWVMAGVILPAWFPTGQPLTRRWRFVVWLGAAGGAGWSTIIFLSNAFSDDGLLGEVRGVRNPLAVPGLDPIVGAVSSVGILALFAGMFAAIVSMVVRTKRSHGVERQQIKVVAYTIAITTVVQLIVANLMNVARFSGSEAVWSVFSQLGIVAIPASLGVALLRYRLYDIDRLINRTIVYAVLSALLVGSYAGAVVVLGALTRPFTHGSDLSIAAATLVIAVMFFPLRLRVQRFIDRRFYRTRYDAARALESFTARLRSETDLSSLCGEIVRVTHVTLRPSHVSLWMSPEGRPRRVLS